MSTALCPVKEGRRAQRVLVNIHITFQYLGKNAKATCTDVGVGGVGICTKAAVSIGAKLTMQISFNKHLSFMGFTGIVVHVRKIEENDGPEIYKLGIQFTHIGLVEEKILEACILELAIPPDLELQGIASRLTEKHLSIFVTDRPMHAGQFARRRVVITGIGVVSPIGIGRQAFTNGLKEGRSGIRRVTRFDATDLPSQLAAEVPDFDPLRYFNPKRIKHMDRCTQFGVSAALMAIEDASLVLEKIDRERCGVLIGTAIGGLRWAFEQNLAYQKGGYTHMDPRSMIATYPNAVSGQVSMELGLKGQTDTISSGCASAGTAFGVGAELIQRGELDYVVVGGTEAPIEPTIYGAMCAAGALSTQNDYPIRTPRPFDAERDGPVLGEGAGVLLFEELEHALQRGAKIYAEFKGWGSSSDAFSLARTDPSGVQAGRTIHMAINDAALALEDVDYINAYGIATPSCDWTETRVLKEVFGERAMKIPVSAIQSMLGYPWAAHGAFQLIANCLAIAEGILAPTLNYSSPDVNCELDLVINTARHARVNVAMSNIFGCGKNVVLLVQRFEE